MTVKEERLLYRLWCQYRVDKPVANQTMIDFFFDVVRQRAELKHCNAFEVLDSITNHPLPLRASA
ncbi:MAG: hypothetical protein AB8B93_13865 [Pseudomonadales bacterium]